MKNTNEINKEEELFRINVILNSIRKVWEEKVCGTNKDKLVTEMCKSWRMNKLEAFDFIQKMIDMELIEEENGEVWEFKR